MPDKNKIKAVFFDLDGTLADTAPDMVAALNCVLRDHNKGIVPLEALRPYVSHGSSELIRRGFHINEDDAQFLTLRKSLVLHYAQNLCNGTRLFPGMAELLETLEQRNLPWGVVTNKPAFLTEPLLKQLEVWKRAVAVVSGDTTEHPKPHPAPLLHACELAKCLPKDCLYVGDAERDIQAGQRAGTATLIARFGYISDEEDPDSWGADGSIHRPHDIVEWI